MEKKSRMIIPWNFSPWMKKTLMYMKLTYVIFLVSVLQALAGNSYSQSTTLSLNMKNATVRDILGNIEDQTEFYFLYSSKIIDVERTVNIEFKKAKINDVLETLFLGSDVIFKIDGRQIVLTKEDNLSNSVAGQEQIKVSGKVSDQSGAPLPGVTVVVKGTAKGTVTNVDGNYSLPNVPENATLLFSFVGMKTQEIAVAGKTDIDVKMEDDAIGIEEVVAVGYGTMKKSDLTGALTSIGSKSLETQPMLNFAQALQGRASGVSASNTTGNPGQTTKIRIRGANSLSGGNDPLVIIDGIPSIYEINPSDVKSIEILKDASATAIYGSRGSNGVILITTFRGNASAPKVVVSSNISVGKVSKKYDLLDAGDYAGLTNDIYGQEMFTDSEIGLYRQNGGADWQKEIFKTSLSQDYQATVSGGEGKVKYLFSGNYLYDKGVIHNTSKERYAFRANIDIDFSKRFSAAFDINVVSSSRFNPDLGGGYGKTNPVLQSIFWSPTEEVYNEDGSYNLSDNVGSLGKNPVLLYKEPYNKPKSTVTSITSHLKYKILEGLDFNVNATINKKNVYEREYTSTYFESVSDICLTTSDVLNWEIQSLLNYKKTFFENHNVIATLGFEESANEARTIESTVNNVDGPTDDITTGSSPTVSQLYEYYALQSFFGRFNYNYASKYFLTATYRADGSSKFRNENKFSYFPSVGVSWVISEEGFMKDAGVFDRLKLRGSWGITGNQAVDPYGTLASLRTRYYSYGSDAKYSGTEPSSPANTELKWESTYQKDVGIDASFFNAALNVSIDYFDKKTVDILLSEKLAYYNGGYTVLRNIGEITNKGLEISTDYMVINHKDYSWDMSFNFSTVRNRVVSLGSQTQIFGELYGSGLMNTYAFVVEPGHPLGSFWGVKYLGIWQEDEAGEALKYGNQPGDSKYEDVNNDYSINSSDYQIIGDANPDYSWGLNNTFTYKNLEFNILIEGVKGKQIYNMTYAGAAVPISETRTITLKEGADVWSTSNTGAAFPAFSSSNINYMNSTRWLQDGSFVKVRNVSIGYTLPKRACKIGEVKFIVAGQNLFTFTKYKGFDPEVNSGGDSDIDSGIDLGVYPTARLITAGIKITF